MGKIFSMPDCEEQIYSNDYLDFIIAKDVQDTIGMPDSACIETINEETDIYFYPRSLYLSYDLPAQAYASIPKCFALLDQSALEVSGILRLQDQPALSLKGEGVLAGFIDTGIDYRNPVFQFLDGTSRIYRIWDQTIRTGEKPNGFSYGSEYTREQINEALRQENPLEIVPSMDTNGHGTFLAGVTCASEDISNNFIGAAPLSEIAVVKLKPAKPYLKQFFYIPESADVFQENDIMTAVRYLDNLARERDMPLVICFALGSSMGNRGKDGALSSYLDSIARKRKRCVVAAVGNEANARHHFSGNLKAGMEYEAAEISVERDMAGFILELWAQAPELYAVSVSSPTGEVLPKVSFRSGGREEYTFVFEQTTVSIDYRLTGRQEGNQLVYLRFSNVRQGIWTIYVYPQSVINGNYNMWLPLREFTGQTVFFLRSNPDHTLTIPSNASQVISVGGYNTAGGGLYLDSGRGFSLSGDVKPELCAPAVNVFGPGLNNRYGTMTGTSAAAAVASGACIQIMEWGLVKRNQIFLSCADIKNMLIRGAGRASDRNYPNPSWGYGTLDVYAAFESLRVRQSNENR